MEKDHMIRLKDDVYHKICIKVAEMKAQYKANYTISEVIEILLLEAKCYENGQK